MRTSRLRLTTTWLIAALAGGATGCSPPLARVREASSAEINLSVFVDPEATVASVRSENGRQIVASYRDALGAAFKEAGYHVVATSTDAHDLTVHLDIGQLGYTYGPWADSVALRVTGSGLTLAEVRRASLNWVHEEGKTEEERLRFAANATVNAISRSARVEDFAVSHPKTTSSSLSVSGAGSASLEISTPTPAAPPATVAPTP